MSASKITHIFTQEPRLAIAKLQELSQNIRERKDAGNSASYYLDQSAIQNFILSFLDECEGDVDPELEEVFNQAKASLSDIESEFLEHIQRSRAIAFRREERGVSQDFLARNQEHKNRLDTIIDRAKIGMKGSQVSISAPHTEKVNISGELEGVNDGDGHAFQNTTSNVQNIYQKYSQDARELLEDLIKEAVKDLVELGIDTPKDHQGNLVKYVISCFGSLARDEASPYSDLEFGVLFDDKMIADEEVKEYFRDVCDLLNLKVINLGRTQVSIQNIKEMRGLKIATSVRKMLTDENGHKSQDGEVIQEERAIMIPLQQGLSFDGSVLGSCKTPIGNKRAVAQRVAEIEQDREEDIAFLTASEILSQEVKQEKIDAILSYASHTISELRSREYELMMTPSQMAQFHNQEWYEADRHLSTTLYSMTALHASGQQDQKDLMDSYEREVNNILSQKVVENEEEVLDGHDSKLITLREKRAFDLLPEAVGRFDPKAGKNQEHGRSFSPKYDFYRPVMMLVDHLAYLYGLGGKEGEKSVWERFDRIFLDQDAPIKIGVEGAVNQKAVENLKWMIDRVMHIRAHHYSAKGCQDEDMILLDECDETEKKEMEKEGLGIWQKEVFEVYFVMMPFFNMVEKLSYFRTKEVSNTGKSVYYDNSLFAQGSIHNLFSNYEEAKDCFEKVVQCYEENDQELDLNCARALNNLGHIHFVLGETQMAATAAERSIKIYESHHPDKISPDHAATLCNFANVLTFQGRDKEAMKSLYQSMAVADEKHMISILHSLGDIHHDAGEHGKAMEFLEASKQINIKMFGNRHVNVIELLFSIAAVHNSMHDNDAAIQDLQEALEISKRIFGEKHLKTSSILRGLGRSYRANGNEVKALEYFYLARDITITFPDPSHRNMAPILTDLGRSHMAIGQLEKGRNLLIDALNMRTEIYLQTPKNSPEAVNPLMHSADIYGFLGEHGNKIFLLEKALKILRTEEGRAACDEMKIADILSNLGATCELHEEYESAEKYLTDVLEIYHKKYTNPHPDVALALHNLGNVYLLLNRHVDGIAKCEEALAMREAMHGMLHLDVAATLNSLGTIYGIDGNHALEASYLQQSLDIHVKKTGAVNKDVATIMYHLSQSYKALGDHYKYWNLIKECGDICDVLGGRVDAEFAQLVNVDKHSFRDQIVRYSNLCSQAAAFHQQALEPNEDSSQLLNKAEESFKESISTLEEVANLSKYSFLLYQEGRIDEAVDLLQKATKLKWFGMSSYSEGDKLTLPIEIQELIDLSTQEDQSIIVDPLHFTYVMLIKINQERGNHNDVQELLDQFHEILTKSGNAASTEIEMSALQVGQSLYQKCSDNGELAKSQQKSATKEEATNIPSPSIKNADSSMLAKQEKTRDK